jgi:hypothetical protein
VQKIQASEAKAKVVFELHLQVFGWVYRHGIYSAVAVAVFVLLLLIEEGG